MQCVLVVDDSADTSRMLARLLESMGYRSAWLTSGAEALQYLREHPADLVILDVMMPGMDGMEVLRRIRTDATLRDLRVVMFSAVSDAQLQQEAKHIGADDYWVKGSLDLAMITRRLEDVFSGR
jgi:CheY-like chemotaxis protein